MTTVDRTVADLREAAEFENAWATFLGLCKSTDGRDVELMQTALLDHAIGRYRDEHPEADASAFIGFDWLRYKMQLPINQLDDPSVQIGISQSEHQLPLELQSVAPQPSVEFEFIGLDRHLKTLAKAMQKSFGLSTPQFARINQQLNVFRNVATAVWLLRHATDERSESYHVNDILWSSALSCLARAIAMQEAVHRAPNPAKLNETHPDSIPEVQKSFNLEQVFRRFGDIASTADSGLTYRAVESIRLMVAFVLPNQLVREYDQARVTSLLLLPDVGDQVCPVCVNLALSRRMKQYQRVLIPHPIDEGLRIVDRHWHQTQENILGIMAAEDISGLFVWKIQFLDQSSSISLSQKYFGKKSEHAYQLATNLQRPLELNGASAGGAFALLTMLHDMEGVDARFATTIAAVDSTGKFRGVEQFDKLCPEANPPRWISHRSDFILDTSANAHTKDWIKYTLQARGHYCENAEAAANVVKLVVSQNSLGDAAETTEKDEDLDLFAEVDSDLDDREAMDGLTDNVGVVEDSFPESFDTQSRDHPFSQKTTATESTSTTSFLSKSGSFSMQGPGFILAAMSLFTGSFFLGWILNPGVPQSLSVIDTSLDRALGVPGREFARIYPDTNSLYSQTDFAKELNEIESSFDLLVNNAGFIKNYWDKSIRKGLKQGVSFRIIMSDYQESNPRFEVFAADSDSGDTPLAQRELAKVSHASINRILEDIKLDQQRAQPEYTGRLEVRWNRKMLFNTIWIRDGSSARGLAHMGLHFTQGKPKWPNLRFSKQSAPELFENCRREFEMTWKDAAPFGDVPPVSLDAQ